MGCGIQRGAQFDDSARRHLVASHTKDLDCLVAEPRRDVTGHQSHDGLRPIVRQTHPHALALMNVQKLAKSERTVACLSMTHHEEWYDK